MTVNPVENHCKSAIEVLFTVYVTSPSYHPVLW